MRTSNILSLCLVWTHFLRELYLSLRVGFSFTLDSFSCRRRRSQAALRACWKFPWQTAAPPATPLKSPNVINFPSARPRAPKLGAQKEKIVEKKHSFVFHLSAVRIIPCIAVFRIRCRIRKFLGHLDRDLFVRQRYGSRFGSSHHQAKLARKPLISTVLWLYDFLSVKKLKKDVNVP